MTDSQTAAIRAKGDRRREAIRTAQIAARRRQLATIRPLPASTPFINNSATR